MAQRHIAYKACHFALTMGIFCFLRLLSPLALCAQQSGSGDSVPSLLPEPSDNQQRIVQDARGHIFNLRLPYSVLDPRPQGAPSPFIIVDLETLPEFPIERSDAVVVGQLTGLQPFLSEDHKSIYTEFYTRVIEVVRSSTGLVPGDRFTILRHGGEVRVPDGRIVKVQISGDGGPISVGNQYLFFLQYRPQAQAYLVVKAWVISQGRLQASFPDDLARASRGRSENNGRPLAEALAILRANR
jgi:hypothetical protein